MTKILCDGCGEVTITPYTLICNTERWEKGRSLTWRFICCLACVGKMRLKMPDMWAAEEFNTGAK